MARLSIIIVNWNTEVLLRECLDSIRDTCAEWDYEVVIVDNASKDGSVSMIQQNFPAVQLILNQDNVGFARANNQAMQQCESEYFLLLNSDACLTSNAVGSMIQWAVEQPEAGILGARLINPDGSFQASYTTFPSLWREFLMLSGLGRWILGGWFPSHGPEMDRGAQMVDYVEGACLLVRRKAYEQVGGLDESFFMYAEEVDWCYRFHQHAWQVWYQPEAVVIHHGGASSKGRRTQREADLYWSRVHFFRKHYGPAAAGSLKILMIWITALKFGIHSILRVLSRGRFGRPVVSVRALTLKLKNA